MSKTIGKIYRAILQLDQLSPGPEITHLRNLRYYNPVGVFFTLFSVLLGFLALKEDILDFLNRENPDITYINKYNTNQSLLFDPKDIKISFSVVADVNNTYFRIPVKDVKDMIFPSISNGNFTVTSDEGKEKATNFTLWDCPTWMFENYNDNLDYDAENITKKELDDIVNNSFCLPDGLMPFLVSNNNSPSILFQTAFLNSILAKYPKISILFLEIRYQSLEISYEGKDYDNKYFRRVWRTMSYALSSVYYNGLNYKLTTGVIERERKQMIFPINDKNSTNFFTPDQTLDTFLLADVGGVYNFIINFSVNDHYLYCKLKYKSIDSILGDFGGILQIFFAGGLFFAETLVRPFFHRSLLNHAYDFHLTDKENEGKFNELVDFLNNADKSKNTNLHERHNGIVEPNPYNRLENKVNYSDNSRAELANFNSIELVDLGEGSNIPENLPPNSSNSSDVSKVASFVINPPELIKQLAKSTKQRVRKNISFSSIFRIVYCYSCSKKRDKMIDRVSEEFEKKCEITEITKLFDEVKVLKSFLLSKQQQELFLLPSINLSKDLENESEEYEEEFEFHKEDFYKSLKKKVKELVSLDWDLKDKTDRALLKNIIISIM